jgi:hypothetical protein
VTPAIEKTCDRLWTLGNAVSVFSAAQFVTLIFAMAGSEFRHAVESPGVRPAIVLVVVLLTAGQLWGIVWCNARLAELEDSTHPTLDHVSRTLARGRIATVVLFGVLSILVLFIGPFSEWVATHGSPPP